MITQTRCAKCGRRRAEHHLIPATDTNICTDFDPAIPASRVRALPRFSVDAGLHPRGPLVRWADIDSLLRDEGVEP